MPRLNWGTSGSRIYETGIDRGVLYVGDQAGVAWTGLSSVEVSPTGGNIKSYYIDGVKYLQVSSLEEFSATINAFTYPDEFGVCDGTAQVRPGLFFTQQRRKTFGFSYRTLVGSDLTSDKGYKIHIVYGAMAEPSQTRYNTVGDTAEPVEFSWTVSTKPPSVSGYKRTSHIVIDSRTVHHTTLSVLEDILYGNDANLPRLPSIDEIVTIFDTVATLEIVANPDGTYTITGPPNAIQALDTDTFLIDWPTVSQINADTYSVNSG